MRRALLAASAVALALAIAAVQLNRKEPGTEPYAADLDASTQISRGEYLARLGNCMGCHTAQGSAAYAGGRRLSTTFGTFVTPNITPDPETGIGRWTHVDFRRAMREGKAPDGSLLYPAFPYTEYTRVTSEDSDAIFAYLQSLPAVVQRNAASTLEFPYNLRPLLSVWRALYFEPGAYRSIDTQSAEWNRGAYLVQGLGHCNACHATRNALGAARGAALGGGEIEGLNWYAPSLSSSAEAGTRDWPITELVRLLSTGVSDHGTASGPMAEVVRLSLQHATAEDVKAIAVYLRSLPDSGEPRARESRAAAGDVPGFAQGRAIYEKHCEDCHGRSGEGKPGAYPPLAQNRSVTLESPLNAIRSLLDGGYPPSTAGNPRPYGMPPYAPLLGNDDAARVLTYVRNAWGNRASAVTPSQIDRNRGGGTR